MIKPLIQRQQRPARGQSLVEMVLCLPLLIFILMGGYYMGSVIMAAQAASDQIHQSPIQKKALANKSADAASTDFNGGTSFDSFRVVYSSGPDATYYDPAILVGTKNISAPFVGDIHLTVAAPINRPLINTNGINANTRTYNLPLNQQVTCPGNRQFASHLYRTMLGRSPSRGEVTSSAKNMDQRSIRWVIKDLAGSPEFTSLSNRQKVTRLYKAILLRSPDPQYQGWVDSLDNGNPVDSVIDGIYGSAENQNNMSADKVPPCS